MSATYITVPQGITRFDAFQALWNTAEYDRRNLLCYNGAEEHHATQVSTAEKLDELLQKQRSLFVRTAGGRVINADFKNFPTIDVTDYDKKYGPGAAIKALRPNPSTTSPEFFVQKVYAATA